MHEKLYHKGKLLSKRRLVQPTITLLKSKTRVDKLCCLCYNMGTQFGEKGNPICSMEAGARIGFFVSLVAVAKVWWVSSLVGL